MKKYLVLSVLFGVCALQGVFGFSKEEREKKEKARVEAEALREMAKEKFIAEQREKERQEREGEARHQALVAKLWRDSANSRLRRVG